MDDIARTRWILAFEELVLTLPDRLPELLEAVRSDDPISGLMQAFECDRETAESLLRLQFRSMTREYREGVLTQVNEERRFLQSIGESVDHDG